VVVIVVGGIDGDMVFRVGSQYVVVGDVRRGILVGVYKLDDVNAVYIEI
jgi:hypothetical protein